jgi:NitT/TauT family transport system permease protein
MATDLTPARTAAELAGLDALDLAGDRPQSRAVKLWSAAWPKLAAIGIALALWQIVVWSGWKDEWILPGPGTVFDDLSALVQKGTFWEAVGTTARRAIVGFAFATVLGLALGVAVARSQVLRRALGSFITGLQTMPSIAWFPLAIVLFKLSEQAIFFVVVLGAAPSIANGVITGVDYVSPVLVRAGRNLGARGLALYRYVIGPASLPAIVAGLKQGWAFAWRSLMAGELLVVIPGAPAIGSNLQHARENTDYPGLISHMIVILIIGIIVDALFNVANNKIRRRWGLADVAH